MKYKNPPEKIIVKIYGSDCFGEWHSLAQRIDYKGQSGWRWCDDKGNKIYSMRDVDRWEFLEQTNQR